MVSVSTRDVRAENRALQTASVEAVQRGVGNVLAVLGKLGEASGGMWRVAEAKAVPSDDGGFLICAPWPNAKASASSTGT